eukprot:6863725-Lingulodinium_polyedra.AAC.1
MHRATSPASVTPAMALCTAAVVTPTPASRTAAAAFRTAAMRLRCFGGLSVPAPRLCFLPVFLFPSTTRPH